MKPLRILLLADTPIPDSQLNPAFFDQVDLIISCGDLSPRYLSLIADLSNKDVFYVHGNHDASYENPEPEGCISLEDRLVYWNGISFLGLGGSHLYNHKDFQYTQSQMVWRYIKALFPFRYNRRLDFLVTHSPAFELHDGKDPCHTGFKLFRWILEKRKPRYFIHGHMHLDYGDYPRIYHFDQTTIINSYKTFMLEIDPKELKGQR